MSVRRITPDIAAENPGLSASFYTGVLGLRIAMDLGWIITFVSPANETAQVNIVRPLPDTPATDYSVEVADVDAAYTRASDSGAEIVYTLRTEPWGVRRFFVRDPHGKVANVLSHVVPQADETQRETKPA